MKLCGFEVGLDQPLFLIAGPCVIESRQLQIDTAGTPARSSTIPSARLAAEQEPQSPTPAITASQLWAISWARSSSTGVPKYDLVYVLTSPT